MSNIWYFEDERGPLYSGTTVSARAVLDACAFLRSAEFLHIQTRLLSDNSETSLYRTGGEICSQYRRSEFVAIIQSLKPLTLGKLATSDYLTSIKKLNDDLSKIRVKNEADRQLQREISRENVEVPQWTVGGLPNFKYPERIHPELIRIEAPSSMDVKPLPEELERVKGIPRLDSLRADTATSFNYNVPSRLMGPPQKFDTLASSGFVPKIGWLCMEIPNFRFGDLQLKFPELDFKFKVTLPSLTLLPNLNIDVSNIIQLPPCIAQHIPPLFMPKVEIPQITLGGGEEFGIYKNGKRVLDNFGKGFNPNFRGITDAGLKVVQPLKSAAGSVLGALSMANSAANAVAARAFDLQSKMGSLGVGTVLKGVPFQLSTPGSSKFNNILSQLNQGAINLPVAQSMFSRNPIFNVDTSKVASYLYKNSSTRSMIPFINETPVFLPTQVTKAISAINQPYQLVVRFTP